MDGSTAAITGQDGLVRRLHAQDSPTGHARTDAVFAVIADHLRDGGCPSLDEIGSEASIRSRQMLVEALDQLEERGLIRRIPGRHRNIRLTEQGRALAAVAS